MNRKTNGIGVQGDDMAANKGRAWMTRRGRLIVTIMFLALASRMPDYVARESISSSHFAAARQPNVDLNHTPLIEKLCLSLYP